MRKAEEDPYSTMTLDAPNIMLEVDIISDSPHWGALGCDLEEFIHNISLTVLSFLGFQNLQKKISFSVLCTDNERVQELNSIHRNQDVATDVLSFPNYALTPSNFLLVLSQEEDIYLGDIALSYGVIYHDALDQDKPFMHHLAHMIVHSLLHLVGYDHEDELEAVEMEDLEIKILAQLNIPTPY